MSKFVNTIILCVILVFSSQLYGQINYEKQVFDFGHVGIDFNVFHKYAYVNDKDREVRIIEADADCDCTTLGLKDSVLGPGDTAFIELAFSTRDYYGPTPKSFKVVTNNPDTAETKFWYVSTIGQWFHGLKPRPISLFFLPGKKSQKVTIPNVRFEQIQITSVVKYDTTFNVKVANEKAGKGEFVELEISPAENLGKGTYLPTLNLGNALPGEKQPMFLSIPIKIVRY